MNPTIKSALTEWWLKSNPGVNPSALTPDLELKLNEFIDREIGSLFQDVDRFEVINHGEGTIGRVFTKWNCSIQPSLQDGGKTLKIFVR